jgi:conjugative transfer signal peptidase TraF
MGTMRGSSIIVLCAALALAMALTHVDRDWLTYNPSPSVPPGIYVRSARAAAPGAFVTVRARDVAPRYAALRDFTRAHDRFIKRVAATEGETVCARGDAVSVHGQRIARLARDHRGYALPRWNGCIVLQADEFFLLGDTADSFDSRYFGVVNAREIEGVWRPL